MTFLIMVRFSKFKKWQTDQELLYAMDKFLNLGETTNSPKV